MQDLLPANARPDPDGGDHEAGNSDDGSGMPYGDPSKKLALKTYLEEHGYFKKIHNYRHAISTSAALDIVVGNVGNIHGNIRKLTSPAYKNCQPAMKWKMVDLVRRRGQGAMGA